MELPPAFAGYEKVLAQFERTFGKYDVINGGTMSDDNTFTATCRVKSVFPDEQGEFTDLHLHNEKTDKKYKVRAWHNTIKPSLQVGDLAKCAVTRIVKSKDGKTTTFFNLIGIDIPDVDINEDQPKTRTKSTGESKNRAFALSYAKDAVSGIYIAQIKEGGEVPSLSQMEDDIIAMAGGFCLYLDGGNNES